MEGFKFLPKDKINRLPETAGVYAFKKGKELLYIGKAINLRARVKQHRELLGFAEQLGYIETGSEFDEPPAHLTSRPALQGSTIEALLLEAQLIKKYQPKHNTTWKDDKNYFYTAITQDDLPRVFITHQIKKSEIRNPCLAGRQAKSETNSKFKILNSEFTYIGPFVDGKALKETLKTLRKIFPYYTIGKHPNDLCPWCHLNLCPGPKPNIRDYKNNLKNLVAVLRGERKSVLRNLKKEMKTASSSQDFEKAAKLRDQIKSLENIISHSAKKITERMEAYDVSNIQGKYATGSMITFINGQPAKNFYRKFKIKIAGKPNDTAMLKEVLSRRFNHPEWPFPDTILIDGGKAQLNVALKLKNSNTKLPLAEAKVKKRTEASSPSNLKNINLMALAKKHNELFMEWKKKPVLLKDMPREFSNLILRLRDEAHRFAISYHKKLRAKALLPK